MEKRSNWPSVDQGIVISLGSRTNRAGQISLPFRRRVLLIPWWWGSYNHWLLIREIWWTCHHSDCYPATRVNMIKSSPDQPGFYLINVQWPWWLTRETCWSLCRRGRYPVIRRNLRILVIPGSLLRFTTTVILATSIHSTTCHLLHHHNSNHLTANIKRECRFNIVWLTSIQSNTQPKQVLFIPIHSAFKI